MGEGAGECDWVNKELEPSGPRDEPVTAGPPETLGQGEDPEPAAAGVGCESSAGAGHEAACAGPAGGDQSAAQVAAAVATRPAGLASPGSPLSPAAKRFSQVPSSPPLHGKRRQPEADEEPPPSPPVPPPPPTTAAGPGLPAEIGMGDLATADSREAVRMDADHDGAADASRQGDVEGASQGGGDGDGPGEGHGGDSEVAARTVKVGETEVRFVSGPFGPSSHAPLSHPVTLVFHALSRWPLSHAPSHWPSSHAP